MFLINGHKQDYLPVNDRAIQFGDGCFTTARIVSGEVCFLAAHLQRLQSACEKLLIPFEQWAELQHEIREMALGNEQGVLKVIISRGSGDVDTAGPAVISRRVFSQFLIILHIMTPGAGKASP